jgi:hypothetical protein
MRSLAQLLACCVPLAALAAGNPRVPEILCPTTAEAESAQSRLPESMAAPVSAELAAQLVYYRPGHGTGVFGPKSWFCRAWSGSSGDMILVTPKPVPPPFVPLPEVTGPAVLLQITDGTDVGRFHLALVAKRLFPLLGQDIIDQVREEHLIPDTEFKEEPYPDDRLQYLSDRLLEYTTPAHASGLGTDSLFQASELPIAGVTMLKPENLPAALIELRLRLPASLQAVGDAILDLETRCLQLRQGCRGLDD